MHVRFRFLVRGSGFGSGDPRLGSWLRRSRNNGPRLRRFRCGLHDLSRRSLGLLRNRLLLWRLGCRRFLLGYRLFRSRRLRGQIGNRWCGNGFRFFGHRRFFNRLRNRQGLLGNRRLFRLSDLFRHSRTRSYWWRLRHHADRRLLLRLRLRNGSSRSRDCGSRNGCGRLRRQLGRTYWRLGPAHRHFRRRFRSGDARLAHRRPSRPTRNHHVGRAWRQHDRVTGNRLSPTGRYVHRLGLDRDYTTLLRYMPFTPRLRMLRDTWIHVLWLRHVSAEACCNKAARRSDDVTENVEQPLRLAIGLRSARQGRLETHDTTQQCDDSDSFHSTPYPHFTGIRTHANESCRKCQIYPGFPSRGTGRPPQTCSRGKPVVDHVSFAPQSEQNFAPLSAGFPH